MSIQIVPLWPHFNMHWNCYGVCIWNVKGKSTFKSYLLEINVLFILQCPNLNIQCIMFCMMSHTHFCPAFVIRNITQFKKIIFLSLLRHASLAATKRTCAPHKFVKMYDPSPIMKQPYFQLLTNGRSVLQSFWNTPLHPFTFLTPLPINEVNDAFQKIVFQWEMKLEKRFRREILMMYVYITKISLPNLFPSSFPMLSHWKRLQNQKGFAHEKLP